MQDPRTTQSLKTPLPPSLTEANGVFQPDLIVGTALRAGIADLRANTFLLDYVFRSLSVDPRSAKLYGEKDRAAAKNWFLKTEFDVLVGHIRPPEGPPKNCITLHLSSSNEAENRLGDVHYFPREDVDAESPALTPVFEPASYDGLTGIVELPSNIADDITVSDAMSIVDKNGVSHQIIDVLSDTSFKIAPGAVDFRSSYIRSSLPTFVTHVESAVFSETYKIGCHVFGEPVFLIWLHSIVVFCLLRYRASLLEARGLQRTQISSSDVGMTEGMEPTQPYYSRYVTLTGYVEHAWPAQISERVLSVDQVAQMDGGGHVPLLPGQTVEDLTWSGDEDEVAF